MFKGITILTIVLAFLCSCSNQSYSAESLRPSEDSANEQAALKKDHEEPDDFQRFMDTWELSGLISDDRVMTDENRNNVLRYFQNFDEIERNYVILLLQSISAGEVTPANSYCDFESGVYLMSCQYCLFDMNLDGFPELILKTGDCEADDWYTVYTISDEALIECGGVSGSHATLYRNDSGRFVRYAGQMGVYDITVSELEGTSLMTQEIAAGQVDFNKEDYPELSHLGFEGYDQCLEFTGIPTLFLAPLG